MKTLLLLFALVIVIGVNAQTGPGGVGNTDGLSTLRWWFDANEETYSDGAAVTSMSDLSGYGNSLSASGTETPTYEASVSDINSLATVSFGYDDELESTYKGNSNESMSYAIVMYHTKTDAYVRVAVQQGGRNTLAAKTGKLFDYVGLANHTSATASNGYWIIHTKTFSGGSDGSTVANGLKYYVNGTLTDEFNYYIENKTDNTWIGGHGSGGGTGLQGSISEVMKFTKVLNEAERIIIENYLSAKYAIAISNDKYTGNGDYDKNVIGIGTESTGSHTISNDNKGLIIEQNSGFDNGDYLIAGNNGETNFATTGDVSSPIQARWRRAWYIDVTDNGTAMTVDITFDFSDAGISQTPGTASNYKLIYRSGTSGNWSDAAPSITPTVNTTNKQVKFSGVSLSSDGYYTIGTIDETNSTLPIELTSFNVKKNKETVKLNWQTATETNNNYFTVERSANAQDWEAIAQIKGAGNSNNLLSYTIVDNKPINGINYYRLKQTDFDGKYSYSSIRRVQLASKEIRIYPNPTHNTISLEGIDATVQNIHIYNVIGAEVGRDIPTAQKQANNWVLDLSSLPTGVYFIKIEDQTFKVFKQ